MTYFHPRDFDPDQQIFESQKGFRKFKSYVGLKNSFSKFNQYLDDFEFIDIEKADTLVNWDKIKSLEVNFE